MKHLLALTLALTLSVTFACAEEIDWQSLTDDELMAISEAANNEMLRRAGVESEPVEEPAANTANVIRNGFILLDEGGVTVTVTADPWVNDYGSRQYIYWTAVAENNSSKEVGISIEDCSVNGWATNGYGFSLVPSGKKSKKDMYIYATDAEIHNLNDVTELIMAIKLYDSNYHTFFGTGPQEYTLFSAE